LTRPAALHISLCVRISLNGEPRELPEGTTVAAMLEALQLPPGRVAVERNKEIVARDRRGGVVLAEGDSVEVVTFVGGG
jgi:thiamine biosynthesis protein ThiS